MLLREVSYCARRSGSSRAISNQRLKKRVLKLVDAKVALAQEFTLRQLAASLKVTISV